jgi:hypothetical protein
VNANEPLTSPDLIRDLLGALRDREWVEVYERCPRGCCGDWHTRCTECDADQGNYKDPDYQKHKEGCRFKALIVRAEAFLAIEEQLAEERERAEEAIERKTSWDHVAQGVPHG